MILNFNGPLNYDIVFLYEQPEVVSEIVTREEQVCTFTILGSDKVITAPVYRLKLNGIRLKTKGGIGMINYYLVCWINRNGGVFRCRCDNAGTYDRIFGDFYDPKTDTWFTEWFIKTAPDKFARNRLSR